MNFTFYQLISDQVKKSTPTNIVPRCDVILAPCSASSNRTLPEKDNWMSSKLPTPCGGTVSMRPRHSGGPTQLWCRVVESTCLPFHFYDWGYGIREPGSLLIEGTLAIWEHVFTYYFPGKTGKSSFQNKLVVSYFMPMEGISTMLN